MLNHKARPARANSLQRMLELERRFMLERQPATNLATSTPAVPDAFNKTAPSSPARPTIQARRMEGQTQKHAGKHAVAARENPAAPQTAPFAISLSSTKLNADVNTGSEREVPTDASTARGSLSPDKASKGVAFEIPSNEEDQDRRRSICQSPSWEAYGRRKKEEKRDQKQGQKRDQKQGQKRDQKPDKDEAAAKTVLATKKRLTKQPPPASSTYALEQTNHVLSAAASAPAKERQRPASALGLTTPIKEEPSARRPRSRAGSFTSLIKSPFESRRASFDATPLGGSGFIGGIKLELERHGSLQKAADVQAKANEADVHPALRTGNERGQRLSAPVKSPPAAPRFNGADPQRRAYPPITRHSTSTAKTRSLVLPAASDKPDAGTMRKWRALVGLKPTARLPTGGTNDGTQQPQGAKKPAVANEIGKPASLLPPLLQIKREIEAAAAAGDVASKAAAPEGSQAALRNGGRVEQGGQNRGATTLENRRWQPNETAAHVAIAQAQPPNGGGGGDGPANHVSQTSSKTLDGSSEMASLPPLEPPSRSSKPTSLSSSTASASSLTLPDETPTPRSPSRRPDRSGASVDSPDGGRRPPLPTPGKPVLHALAASPKPSVESYHTTTTNSSQHESHFSSAKSSMDSLNSAQSRNNELATSGASLRPPKPRDNNPHSEAILKLETISTSTSTPTGHVHSFMQAPSSPTRKSSFLCDDSDFTVRRLAEHSLPATGSSDNSSYDDFYSPSVPGTPDTSRPQSEKGLPPVFPDIEKRAKAAEEPRASAPRKGPRPAGNHTARAQTVAMMALPQAPYLQQLSPGGRPRAPSGAPPVAGTSFLPKLKHQPLKAVDKCTPKPASYLEEARKATPLAPPPQTFKSPQLIPKVTPPPSIRSQLTSSTTDVSTKSLHYTSASTVGPGSEPIAKMFVECCGCKFYHDMPSNLYEAMATPEAVVRARGGAEFAEGAISMTVKCPWCSHEMSTKCCAGYAAMVIVKQRLH